MRLDTRQVIKALDFVLDQNDLSSLQRGRMKKRLRKAVKQGKLSDLELGPEWSWRICAANLCLGHINQWWGWETRSEVIWDLCNSAWQFPRWNGDPCKLYVLAEQGIGDEIFFSSGYSRLLRKNRETQIECDSRLIPAFRRTFGDYFESRWKGPVELSTEAQARTLEEPRGDYDAFIPAGNVLKLFVHRPEDFVQDWIVMDPQRTQYWTQWLSKYEKPWIGASWVGRQGRLNPEIFEGSIFNLNYEGTGGFITPPCVDFDDTWHFISALDRVDCVTNTVVHMAGAIGVPVNAIQAPPIYGELNNRLQWQFGKLSPYFYPQMRVFQSERDYVKAEKDLGAISGRSSLKATNSRTSTSNQRPQRFTTEELHSNTG